MSLIRRAKGVIITVASAAIAQLLAKVPPDARDRTQAFAGQVLERAARRWPVLADLVGAAVASRAGRANRHGWEPPTAPAADPSVSPYRGPTEDATVSTPFDAAQAAVPEAAANDPADASTASGAQAVSPEADLHDAIAAPTWEARLAAVRRLAQPTEELTAAQVLPTLVEALADSSSEVAAAAVESLHQVAPLTDTRANDQLSAVLRDRDGYFHVLVRALSARALGDRLGPDDAQPLLDAVSDPSAEVSLAAIAALGTGGFSHAAERLTEVVTEPPGYFLPLTRLAAAKTLAGFPDRDAAQLADLLERESDPEVRAALRSGITP